VGRLCSIRDGIAQFSGGLANGCRLADLKMNRLLDRLDRWTQGLLAEMALTCLLMCDRTVGSRAPKVPRGRPPAA
jgi:hypothetical protein